MDILELARSVKRGVKLLDKKIPNWRQVMRKYEDQFNFADGECCILGTLEHHSGRLQVLNQRKAAAADPEDAYRRAAARLGLNIEADEDELYGFNVTTDAYDDSEAVMGDIGDLWRAEFE